MENRVSPTRHVFVVFNTPVVYLPSARVPSKTFSYYITPRQKYANNVPNTSAPHSHPPLTPLPITFDNRVRHLMWFNGIPTLFAAKRVSTSIRRYEIYHCLLHPPPPPPSATASNHRPSHSLWDVPLVKYTYRVVCSHDVFNPLTGRFVNVGRERNGNVVLGKKNRNKQRKLLWTSIAINYVYQLPSQRRFTLSRQGACSMIRWRGNFRYVRENRQNISTNSKGFRNVIALRFRPKS